MNLLFVKKHFRSNFEATPPPILIDRGVAVLENEAIERHIMKKIPGGHNLFVQDKEVASKIENLYNVSADIRFSCICLLPWVITNTEYL